VPGDQRTNTNSWEQSRHWYALRSAVASATIRQREQLAAVESKKNSPTSFKAGVLPKDAWTCPATHPIKGNITTYSGEPCIYHPPAGAFYGETKPEWCCASVEEPRQDGCRASKQ
jgi:hypothetical protein